MTRLLVASTGGHLAELVLLAPRLLPSAGHDLWVTFDSQQSRTLLAEQSVRYVRNTPPRDWRSVIANARTARSIFRTASIETVVSNGAGIALSFLPLARAKDGWSLTDWSRPPTYTGRASVHPTPRAGRPTMEVRRIGLRQLRMRSAHNAPVGEESRYYRRYPQFLVSTIVRPS
jgi:hypothetical protein